jgi:hypothetical protein
MAAVGGATYYGVNKKKQKEAKQREIDLEDQKKLAATAAVSTGAGVAAAQSREFYGPAGGPPTHEATMNTQPAPEAQPLAYLPAIPNEPVTVAGPSQVAAGFAALVDKRCIATEAFEPEFEDDMGLAVGDVVVVQNARSGGFEVDRISM